MTSVSLQSKSCIQSRQLTVTRSSSCLYFVAGFPLIRSRRNTQNTQLMFSCDARDVINANFFRESITIVCSESTLLYEHNNPRLLTIDESRLDVFVNDISIVNRRQQQQL